MLPFKQKSKQQYILCQQGKMEKRQSKQIRKEGNALFYYPSSNLPEQQNRWRRYVTPFYRLDKRYV